MSKYENNSNDSMSRLKRNEHIYNSTDMRELSRIKTNNNVSVISDAHKNVDIDKIKKYIYSNNDTNKDKNSRVTLELPKEEEVVIERKKEKDYDVNSILEKAIGSREVDYEENRHRKLNNTQIDILKSIKMKEDKKEDSDYLPPSDELNTEEKTIVDLIQNIQNNSNQSDLLDDLMGSDDETVVAGFKDELKPNEIKDELFDITQDLENIKEPENEFTKEINLEIEKLKEDKKSQDKKEDESENEITPDNSFYTNSVTFNKSDFEGFDEIENSAKKSAFFSKLAVILVILILLGTIFLIVNAIFDLNII